MATPGIRATGCTIVVSVFDGARRRYTGPEQPLVRILDVHGHSVLEKFIEGAGITVNGLPFHNNFADAYSVVVWQAATGMSASFRSRCPRKCPSA